MQMRNALLLRQKKGGGGMSFSVLGMCNSYIFLLRSPIGWLFRVCSDRPKSDQSQLIMGLRHSIENCSKTQLMNYSESFLK